MGSGEAKDGFDCIDSLLNFSIEAVRVLVVNNEYLIMTYVSCL